MDEYDIFFYAVIVGMPVLYLLLRSRGRHLITGQLDSMRDDEGWVPSWGMREDAIFIDRVTGSMYVKDAWRRVREGKRLKIQVRFKAVKTGGGLIEDVYKKVFFERGVNEPRARDNISCAFFDNMTVWEFMDDGMKPMEADEKSKDTIDTLNAQLNELQRKLKRRDEDVSFKVQEQLGLHRKYITPEVRKERTQRDSGM